MHSFSFAPAEATTIVRIFVFFGGRAAVFCHYTMCVPLSSLSRDSPIQSISNQSDVVARRLHSYFAFFVATYTGLSRCVV